MNDVQHEPETVRFGEDGPSAAEGDRLVDQQRMLAEFGGYALGPHDLDDVLREACRLVLDGLGERIAKVIEARPDGRLYLRLAVGFEPTEEERWIPGGSGSSIGHALETGTSTISLDAPADPRFERSPIVERLGIRSMINVLIPDPLSGAGDRYGVLEVDSPEGREFTDDEVAFLRVYANLVGAAIAQDRARAHMARMVEQREATLRELQHRIKNNLATVTGLVRLQSREARHPETVEQLGKIGQRIETLRLVHERLYARKLGERVALRPFLEELMANLGAFHEAERHGVEIEVRVGEHEVEADLAIPVGLLVNEFVTNSFKHAFAGRGGRIEVRLVAERDMLRLEMADDGPGLPAGFGDAGGPRGGTGARIIAGLAKQIGGGAEWMDGPGTRLAVRFPAG